MSNTFAPDYVTVNERIEAFRAKYPEGSLQSEVLELSESRVVIRGIAYRTPDDPRPGIGTSAMSIPGKTPYTRDSEVENCETSAWGRALAALGFEVKRAVASREEVDAKRGAPEKASRYRKNGAGKWETGLDRTGFIAALEEHGIEADVVKRRKAELFGDRPMQDYRPLLDALLADERELDEAVPEEDEEVPA